MALENEARMKEIESEDEQIIVTKEEEEEGPAFSTR